MKIKLNARNINLLVRRIIAIALIAMGGYLAMLFAIKSIAFFFLLLSKGVGLIDLLFSKLSVLL